MDISEALHTLGVSAVESRAQIRRAYRDALLRVHPDVGGPAAESATQTRNVVVAWSVLKGWSDAELQAAVASNHASGPHGEARSSHVTANDKPPVAPRATQQGTDSIAVIGTRESVTMLLVDALHNLGDVSYADPSGGLFEALVEFVDGPMCSVVTTLQGRTVATGGGAIGKSGPSSNSESESLVEIMVSIEAISVPDAPKVPSLDGVTRLLTHTINQCEIAR